MNASLSWSVRPTTSSSTRQHDDHDTLIDERPQPGAGPPQRPEAVDVGEHRAADAEGERDERADHLVRRAARGGPLLLQLVGDLGLELGQDVALAGRWPARSSRSSLMSAPRSMAGAAVGSLGQVDVVLLDQVGVPLLVLLELGHDLVAGDLHRREAVLLVELLVLLGLEGGLHALGEGVLHVLGVPFGTVMKRYCATSTSRPCSCAVGHVGKVLDALGAEDGERDELAGLDVLDRLADLQAGGVDLAAEHGGQGGGAAVERDGLALDAGVAEQQRAGELRAGADAGGAVGDLLGRVLEVLERWRSRCRGWPPCT